MNTAYDLEVRQHCPNARVVREVISRVRVDANQLRTQTGVQGGHGCCEWRPGTEFLFRACTATAR